MNTLPQKSFNSRQHLYVLLVQFFLMFYIQVVMRSIEKGMVPIPLMAGRIGMLIVLVLVHYLAFITVKAYLKNTISKIAYGLLIFGGMVLLDIAGITNDRILFIAATTVVLSAVLIWQYFIVRDIFFGKHDLWDSIVGAANIYWLFITVFGYLYALMGIFFPGILGVEFPDGNMSMLNGCFRLSVYIMVGMDAPYTDMNEVLGNLTLFQAAISNLYIIFAVGRLFSR